MHMENVAAEVQMGEEALAQESLSLDPLAHRVAAKPEAKSDESDKKWKALLQQAQKDTFPIDETRKWPSSTSSARQLVDAKDTTNPPARDKYRIVMGLLSEILLLMRQVETRSQSQSVLNNLTRASEPSFLAYAAGLAVSAG